MGARVTILDVSAERMRYLDDVFNGRVELIMSNSYNIAEAVESADLLIGGGTDSWCKSTSSGYRSYGENNENRISDRGRGD